MDRKFDDLYLSKEPDLLVREEITGQLAKHQIEGIRFLYRQYKKNKPGIILNDPSGYGKKAQITIFLNTIKSILTQPVLILCNEIEIPKWKYHYQQWSDDDNDIIFESKKPYANKRIFVTTFDSIDTFSQRNWSIVVVDDPVSLKMFRPLRSICGAFRIWLISIDLKAHLNTFAAINEWVNPTLKFCHDKYKAKKTNYKDVIEKAILLDSYFEDIVLRRGVSNLGESQPEPIFSPVAQVRVKNKDPTGTKVKKSKKRILDEDDDLNDAPVVKRCSKKENKSKRNKRMIESDDDNDDYFNNLTPKEVCYKDHAETSIRNTFLDCDEDISTDVAPEEGKHEEPVDSSQELVLNYDFSNTNSVIASEQNLEVKINQRYDKTELFSVNENVNNEIIERIAEEIVMKDNLKSQNKINELITHELGKANQTYYENKRPSNEISIKKDNIYEESHKNGMLSDKDDQSVKDNKNIQSNTNITAENVYSDEDRSLNESKESSSDAAIAKTDVNISKLSETILTDVFFSNPKKTKKMKVSNKVNDEVCSNAIHNKEKIEETNKIDVSLVESKSDNETSFDDKLKELQESSIKKFKGSFLDNLF